MISGDQWLLFFVAIAIALGLQLVFTSRQALALTRQIHALRSHGRVAVGMGGGKWFGRRVFIAIAVQPDGRVVDAIRLRGVTHFARPTFAPYYLGMPLDLLAGDAQLPACTKAERTAARQAAQTLSAAGGKPTADGAQRGKENSSA